MQAGSSDKAGDQSSGSYASSTSSEPRKKIFSQKLSFKERAKSKIGSLDNADHRPGGGNVKAGSSDKAGDQSSGSYASSTSSEPRKKIFSQKLSFKERAKSKIGSLDNADHRPGGGNVKIPDYKLDFRKKAQAKVGSLDNVDHKPGGGEVRIWNEKLHFREKAHSKIGSKPHKH
ncbi:MAPT [Cordylochernes scorpioides]|uniref:Microtubule-associated protein n=1 Tax=Cordylochernes scorpioides TaxID=51811 RepID=A0ABY6KM00_9ARAC|nr:MAPT [Cordylochernes scorpioides]